MKRIALAPAALAALTLTASLTTAYAADREIGDWSIHTEQSAFKEGSSIIVAGVISNGYVLALRCLQGDLSIGLGSTSGIIRSGEYNEGEHATIKFRAGKGEIIERTATAISDSVFQIDDVEDIMTQIGNASVFAVQMEVRNTRIEISFHTRGNGKVSQLVLQSCK